MTWLDGDFACNVQTVKPLARSSWFHVSFENVMPSFPWSIRALVREKCGRFVQYIVLQDTIKRFQSDIICDGFIS